MNILITGASRGIGRAMAIEFAKNKHDLLITYKSKKKDTMLFKKELEEKYGINCYVMKCDIGKEMDIDFLVSAVRKYFDHLDGLVNNAGIALDNDFELKDKEEFLKVLNVNLIGTYLMCKKFGKMMYDNKRGKIINIGSTNGIDTPYMESVDYDASKAGIISLTHNFANYLAPYVCVNAVCPGWINTDMNSNLSDSFRKRETRKILAKRFGEPSEVAKLVYFLMSDDASYINDSIIRIDGGCKR